MNRIMKASILCGPLVALLVTLTGSAHAQCGSTLAQRGALLASTWNLPPTIVRPESPEAMRKSFDGRPAEESDISIVGLWDVKFTSKDGQLYDEGFDVYHSDGTELMNDTPPPALGNVCLGVWAKMGRRNIVLKHVFWIFESDGSLIGRGVIHEQITLSSDGNSYTGTFQFEFRDLMGHTIPSMPDVAGDLTAQRITAS
jgi:hypothetical protein